MSEHDDRLRRLFDTPLLARVVPHLPPETLHQLIRTRGLDVSGELVAAATPGQLTAVLDIDLWPSPRPGRDERFDEDRFGEWLELLADAGDDVAARTVAAMDADLVIAGFSRYVRVFDPATFERIVPTEEVSFDSDETPFDELACKVGGYLVRARRTDAWDAVVALLLALDAQQPEYFHAVMRGCRRLSNDAPEIDGLDDLLAVPAQQLHDITLDRERRRTLRGYATPADARAFLQMARQRGREPADAASSNPLVAAAFRMAHEAAASFDGNADSGRRAGSESVHAVVELLTEAGVVPERPRALLEGTGSEPSRFARIRALMAHLYDTNPAAYLGRSQELAFLTNTLAAAGSVQARALTVQEASDAAVGTCNLGLEHWPETMTDAFLVDHDLVSAFEEGWRVLNEQVSLFTANSLIRTLADLQSVDVEIQRGLYILRRELVRHRDAGTPWQTREALGIFAMLDPLAWTAVLGLLDECPVLPLAVTAILEGHTGAVNPTAFEFISTTGQLQAVRAFMARLPDVLSGV